MSRGRFVGCLLVLSLVASCGAASEDNGSAYDQVKAPGVNVPEIDCGPGDFAIGGAMGPPGSTPGEALREFLKGKPDLPRDGYEVLGKSDGYVVYGHQTESGLDITVSLSSPPADSPAGDSPEGWAAYGVQWCETPR